MNDNFLGHIATQPFKVALFETLVLLISLAGMQYPATAYVVAVPLALLTGYVWGGSSFEHWHGYITTGRLWQGHFLLVPMAIVLIACGLGPASIMFLLALVMFLVTYFGSFSGRLTSRVHKIVSTIVGLPIGAGN